MSYRQIDIHDVKYAYAAYKLGALPDIPDGLSPSEFQEKFSTAIVTHCDGCWLIFAPTKRGVMPVGMITAAWAPLQVYLVVTGIVWFPWASKRNIIEGVVCFFNKARKEFKFMGYALPEHKKIYEVCMKHAIMRRVGTSRIVIPGKDCAVFETLEPQGNVISRQSIRGQHPASPIHS